MELSKRTLKQIKILESNYDFDTDKGIVTIPLHYETPDELIDEHISRPGKPKISADAISYLQDIIAEIPGDFSIDFALTMEDYGDYTHSQLLSAIRKAIENTYYYHDESQKKDNVLAAIFIITGVLFLALELTGEHYNWFGAEGSISTDFIVSLLDIVAWVLVWEGGALLFLTYEKESTVFRKNIRCLQQIRFVSENGDTLSVFDRDDLNNNMVQVGKREIIARNFILFSFPLIIALNCVDVAEYAPHMATLGFVDLISCIISWIMTVIMTVANISFYRGKGPLKNLVFPLSLVWLGSMLLSMIGWIINGDFSSIFFRFDCFLTVMILLHTICLAYMRKQNVDVHFEKAGGDNEVK